MKQINKITFVTGGELQSHGSNGIVKGRIRFNTSTNIWEQSNNNGSNWFPFNALPSGGTQGQALIKSSSTENDATWINIIRTVNGQTGDVSIGGFAAKTCYVVGAGGDDASAEIGNILRPFETISGAIEVARTVAGSVIEVLPGTYNLGDIGNINGYDPCQFGLMYPNASYDYYFHPNSIVNYHGTYGLYISDSNTFGNVYGYGQFDTHGATFSGTVDGVSNYAVNIGIFNVRKQINGTRLISQNGASTANLVRVGSCSQTGFSLFIDGPVVCRGGHSLFVDTNSRLVMSGKTDLQNTAFNSTSRTIVINNPITMEIKNILIVNYAYGFGRSMNGCIDIENITNVNTKVEFKNVQIYVVQDAPGFKLIHFKNTAPVVAGDISFDKCLLQNRNNISFTIYGTSFFADNDISFKIIDTYVNADIASTSGTVTNLISGGVGLVYNTNL